MDIDQAEKLLQRYRTGISTHSDNELIERWFKELNESGDFEWGEGEKVIVQQMMEARIMNHVEIREQKESYWKPRIQWWAAASIILFLSALSYYLFFNNNTEKVQIVKVLKNDVEPPQLNKAMITLSNGKQVQLDKVEDGALAIQGNVKLIKLSNGKIVYESKPGQEKSAIEYNTLINPRGSKVINMTLSDGSKIWLNAGSTITYPISFKGKERKVSVTGEAYFEVAPDALMPFIVNNGAMDVRVLGTQFNVNAFEDNGSNIKVTLMEGSVKIKNGIVESLLKPGQQAVVTKEINVLSNIDLNLVMAWKNGYFQFDNASLQSVLKEVSRWYDVDVIYAGNNQLRQFVGEIQRDLSLSEVIKILEKNHIYFRIEGKRLIVLAD